MIISWFLTKKEVIGFIKVIKKIPNTIDIRHGIKINMIIIMGIIIPNHINHELISIVPSYDSYKVVYNTPYIHVNGLVLRLKDVVITPYSSYYGIVIKGQESIDSLKESLVTEKETLKTEKTSLKDLQSLPDRLVQLSAAVMVWKNIVFL